MEDYSLADLTKITGAKRRSVQLWAEAGVILAIGGTDRAGSGTHRRFDRNEAILACLVHSFAKLQVPIGKLLEVSRLLRSALSGAAGDVDWTDMEAAIRDEQRVYLLVATWVDGFRISFYVPNNDADEMDIYAALGAHITEHEKEPESSVISMLVNTHLSGLR